MTAIAEAFRIWVPGHVQWTGVPWERSRRQSHCTYLPGLGCARTAVLELAFLALVDERMRARVAAIAVPRDDVVVRLDDLPRMCAGSWSGHCGDAVDVDVDVDVGVDGWTYEAEDSVGDEEGCSFFMKQNCGCVCQFPGRRAGYICT